MANWDKKPVDVSLIKNMVSKYNISKLEACILARRGYVSSEAVLYFLESDSRFEHNPFLFNDMEDAVDRILSAIEEGEKVLVFGDRDADGVTATALLYNCLKKLGCNVVWQVPTGDEVYGLSRSAIDNFKQQDGSLIITVDCGISCKDEVSYAQSLHIDVIVTDHHNIGNSCPTNCIIINPKVQGSNYPFRDVSGCAIAYKLSKALRYAKDNENYKQEICLLDACKTSDGYIVNCATVCNLLLTKSFSFTFQNDTYISSNKRKLLSFLEERVIYVWNPKEQKEIMTKIFGNSVDFYFMDLSLDIGKAIPTTRGKNINDLVLKSKFALYASKPLSRLQVLYNLFVSYSNIIIEKQRPDIKEDSDYDIQLVAIAALADIMPLVDENRIFLKRALKEINSNKKAMGLTELLIRLNLLQSPLSSIDLAWNVTPTLNAAGRLGESEIAVELFTNTDSYKRDLLANKLIILNNSRKQLTDNGWNVSYPKIQEFIEKKNSKIFYILDKKIHRGVTGLLATKISKACKAPAIVATYNSDNIIVGSMRSSGNFHVTEFLKKFDKLFMNYGGHDAAAGFALKQENFADFEKQLHLAIMQASLASFQSKSEDIKIDANVPREYLVPELLDMLDDLEPYGHGFEQLVFATNDLVIADASICGQDSNHLRLMLDTLKYKWVAMFWGEGKRFRTQLDRGCHVDIIYQITRNFFRGLATPQIIISELKLRQ